MVNANQPIFLNVNKIRHIINIVLLEPLREHPLLERWHSYQLFILDC